MPEDGRDSLEPPSRYGYRAGARLGERYLGLLAGGRVTDVTERSSSGRHGVGLHGVAR
ncbi:MULTISPECIES: hypothetical protein [unclassified Frankia]|uniref:hypothetical protein n=1 Tax=unclassified Frankia TaxID=2632575 RepID=UPI002024E327